jgi:HD-GYP domain-containing protein (c-di-GMP phosphodiesterase class II)
VVSVATPQAALDPAVETAIGDLRARRPRELARREWVSAVVLGGGFLAAAILIAIALPPSQREPGPLALVLLLAAFGLAFRLDFEVGTGSAVPTQLVLVPMLFIAPLSWVPFLVAGGILLGSAIDYVRRTIHLQRVLLSLVSGWYVLAPVVVLGIAGEAPPSLASFPLYLMALVAQLSVDFLSSAAHERLTLGVRPTAQLRAMSLVWLVDAALSSVGLAVAFGAVDNEFGFLLALPLILLLAVFARERRLHIDNALELSAAYRGTAFLLEDVVEADDAYTGAHSRDVVELSLAVGAELGLGAEDLRDLEFVALLHDVGKVRIPKEIINKPGRLNDEERAIINTHTIEGELMLKKVGGLLGRVGAVVRSCHERWDGQGYPDGLSGEDVPLVARIVALCDAYNAMITDRPYRAALPEHEAMAEVAANSGSQFDPRAVDALVAVLGRERFE